MAERMDFQNVGAGGLVWRYSDQGDGPVVMLVHGFPDTPHSWKSIVDRLVSEGYRTIVPFLRGYHPDTIVAGRDYRAETLGADLVGLAEALELEDVALVGHDYGASAAYQAVHQDPDRWSVMVPIAVPHPGSIKPSPGLLYAVRHFYYFKLPGSDRLAARNDFSYIRNLFRRWAPEWVGDPQSAAEADIIAAVSNDDVLHEVLQYYRDLELAPDRRPAPRFSLPTLGVCGSDDMGGHLVGQFEASERFYSGHYELLVVPGGQWPHRVGEPVFVDRLLRLLAAHT